MRLGKKILLGVLAVTAAGVAAVLLIGPRNLLGMLRYDQRREGDLAAGHPAPDVSLVSLDGRTRTRLREHVGDRPLVLVFGSYT